ncbi:hypothetical protein COCMIDRAFT_98704 [Bipolaris oryzae ATCC 44560]|uniref:Uncharacterized protein n=1 Tax=Bipolaris oryzae ATCC 44560 TaxID=930090 RepID=W6Z2S1_COCMI|nr:uncharacterized protein COCMIDRAFT_98704 [Bipolaris oryzae ATCC 44560]EUC44230.1 hypothetical protein COCMIDRAFT_98704 [Bipolaris oryzae ATCC 44560]
MPPKATEKADKMFSADVVAAVLYSTGTTSLSMKNYEMMSSLDGKKSAYGFQHDFRSVIAKAKELKARVEGGEEFAPVASSAKRGPTTPVSTSSKRKNAEVSDVDRTPSKPPSQKRTKQVKQEEASLEGNGKESGAVKGFKNGIPEDFETFIKSEAAWEERYV